MNDFDPQEGDLVTFHKRDGKLYPDADIWRVTRRTPAMVDLVAVGWNGGGRTERRRRGNWRDPWGFQPVTRAEFDAHLARRETWKAWDASRPPCEDGTVGIGSRDINVYSRRDPALLRRHAADLLAIAEWLEREPGKGAP